MRMNVQVNDKAGYDITSREWTDQGYLKVPGTVARTGVQSYLAKELNLSDRKPNEIVNVYRPPEEVFSTDSLQSYEDVDVTDDHPSDLVSADSFKDVAVGHTTDSARPDGDYVVVDMIIKDADAIDAVQNGKVALSAGYTARYDYEPGQTKDGQSYEFVQRDIKINHVALVGKGRAGQEARLHDHKPKKDGSKMANVVLDGQTIELEDKAQAQLVQKAYDEMKAGYEEMEKKVKEMEDEAGKAREELEQAKADRDKMQEERDQYMEQSKDSAIAERIQAVSDARSQAQKIAGDKFTCDSVDIPTIQRESLKAARPTVDWDDKSEAYVKAAWDLELERSTEDRATESHQRFSHDMATATGQPTNDGVEAYDNFLAGKQAN
jgi:hypothetical protein